MSANHTPSPPPSNSLSPEELQRYARHIVLHDVGGHGQAKIKRSRVLIIGAGGLGCPAAAYLAAAGVGSLGVMDHDRVSLSNLQRQILFHHHDVGKNKARVAALALQRLNPHVRVTPIPHAFSPNNALDLLNNYDVALDGTDSFRARLLISDACFLARKPLVSAAVSAFHGQLSVFTPYLPDPKNPPHRFPSYRCLIPEAPPPEQDVDPCRDVGVLGAVTGILGSLQALETIKIITGAAKPLVGKLLLLDALQLSARTVRLARDPKNPLNGDRPSITNLSHHLPA